jgi:hypothetical protein
MSFGTLRHVALVNTEVSDKIDCENVVARGSLHRLCLGIISLLAGEIEDSHYLKDGGDIFLRNVGSYKSHTA